jgi:SAM-dependent methyltransferase
MERTPYNLAVSQVNQYQSLPAIYDALMSGVPYTVWLARMERAVRERDRNPKSVLDVACGTGAITELLYRRGYRPLAGFDIAPEMIQIAQTKASSKRYEIPYHVADLAELDMGGQQFDWLVSVFDSLNYIVDPARLREGLQRLFAHTAPGGVFTFDMNAAYALRHGLFTQHEKNGPIEHDWRSHWDEETKLCRVEMDFWVTDPHTSTRRYFHETHQQRGYTLAEMRLWLTEAGWTQIEVFGNYGDRVPNSRSDRWLFVCEKPE